MTKNSCSKISTGIDHQSEECNRGWMIESLQKCMKTRKSSVRFILLASAISWICIYFLLSITFVMHIAGYSEDDFWMRTLAIFIVLFEFTNVLPLLYIFTRWHVFSGDDAKEKESWMRQLFWGYNSLVFISIVGIAMAPTLTMMTIEVVLSCLLLAITIIAIVNALTENSWRVRVRNPLEYI